MISFYMFYRETHWQKENSGQIIGQTAGGSNSGVLAGVASIVKPQNDQVKEYKYWRISDKGACQLQQDLNIQDT